MSAEAVTYYRVVCDACGMDLTAETGEHTAWEQRWWALDEAEGCGAMSFDDGAFVVCDRCRLEFREHAERDDLEPLDDLREETPNPDSAALYAQLVEWAGQRRSAPERGEQHG